MLCEKPFTKNGDAFACGGCIPCRVQRRRIWAHRIMLEQLEHSESCFVTLTYDDQSLRISSKVISNGSKTETVSRPSLHPPDLRNFLKRLRKAVQPSKLRYYGIGEYGSETHRPHYHLALFGYPNCLRGRTRSCLGSARRDWANCCSACRTVGNVWKLGDVELAPLERGSASYIAGYIMKKLDNGVDTRLEGRHPEFARMSNRPGIGFGVVPRIAAELDKHGLETLEDVPTALRHGPHELPLGRYLVRKLRTELGRDEKTPEKILEAYKEEMRPVREAAFDASKSLKSAIVENSVQKRRNLYARLRLRDPSRNTI